MSHPEAILRQFSLQAIPFTQLPGHSEAMGMLIELAQVQPSDTVLDVACGPGLVAAAIAPHATHVTGIDITPKMIEQARALQQEKGLSNLSWQVGDVLPLPFPGHHFSVVMTRYSFHHFLNPAAVLAEMLRVCQPGGRVMVVDAVLPSDQVEAYNRMEKLRDPSHTQALSFDQMAALIAEAGLEQIQTARYKVEMELERQLAASFPDAGDDEKIRALFRADLEADRMGVGAHEVDGAIHFAYPILITVGRKPR